MNASQGLAALTAALVHPSASDRGQARVRHQCFFLRALGLPFAALAVAPFFIAFHGAPTPIETLLFSLCLAPLGAVMLVSKSGHLLLGHCLCVLCLIAGSVILAVSREAGLGCALAWLIVAQTEGLLSFDRVLVVWTSFVSVLVFLGIGAAALTGLWGAAQAAPAGNEWLIGLPLACAIINAVAMAALRSRLREGEAADNDRSQTIADTLDDLVVSFDAGGAVDFVGRACERLLALPSQDLMGRGFFEAIHVADRPLFLKTIGDAGHGKDTLTATVRLKSLDSGSRHDGAAATTFLWIEVRARHLSGDRNAAHGFCLNALAAYRSGSKALAAYRSGSKALAAYRSGSKALAAYRSGSKALAARGFGTKPPAVRGFDMESIATRAASSRVIALVRNVTAQKRVEADLEAARQAAEIATRSQDHFLANMSHELRTPLNAIIGFSEMLGHDAFRPSDPAKRTEYARIIHQSGQHLLAVVNSILDMAKIQSGTFSIVPETFDIASLIASSCEIITLKAQEGRIEIVQADTSTIEPVVGDRRACKQILINLLSNAVKFTPENGCVTIEAKPDGTSLLISVSDTGIGIGAADLARLGDPFFQAKSAFDRPYEGTGLGLSVVRGLVGLHGGSMAIESEPGHGTCVTVRLPLDCRHATPPTISLKIETIARRHAQDRFAFPPLDTMVKKIA